MNFVFLQKEKEKKKKREREKERKFSLLDVLPLLPHRFPTLSYEGTMGRSSRTGGWSKGITS